MISWFVCPKQEHLELGIWLLKNSPTTVYCSALFYICNMSKACLSTKMEF